MIKLTDNLANEPIYINEACISAVEQVADFTSVHCALDEFFVKESAEKVLELMGVTYEKD